MPHARVAATRLRAGEASQQRGYAGPGLLTLAQEQLTAARTTPPVGMLALWARQTALLLRTGLTIAEALDTLREQAEDPRLSRLTAGLYRSVIGGEQLSAAMAGYPNAFPAQLRGLVRIGEESGTLPDTCGRMAQMLEREGDLRRRLSHATFYPTVIAAGTTALCLAMTVFLVPQYGQFYADFSGGEAQLPLITRKVLGFADWLTANWLWLFGIPLLLAVWRLWRSGPGRRFVDPWQIKLPLLGLIARKTESARCARGLAALLATGAPLDEALRLAGGCTANHAVQQALVRVHRRVSVGTALPLALRLEPVLAPLLPSVVAAATNAAEAAANLEHLADRYDADVARSLRVLLRQVEPALLILIGLYVGVVAWSLYAPIFNLVDVIQ